MPLVILDLKISQNHLPHLVQCTVARLSHGSSLGDRFISEGCCPSGQALLLNRLVKILTQVLSS